MYHFSTCKVIYIYAIKSFEYNYNIFKNHSFLIKLPHILKYIVGNTF